MLNITCHSVLYIIHCFKLVYGNPSKGTVARDFFALFFYQTVPPGPISDVLGLFNFFANFQRVIGLLKHFTGVWDTDKTIKIDEVRHFFKR